MAISLSDISALPDYTDAQILKLYRWALVNGAAGESRSINGRSITFPPIDKLTKTIEWLETRAQTSDSADSGGGNVLVQFGERV